MQSNCSQRTVREERLEPVIVEHISYFTVEFTETAMPDGRFAWETDRLYEIPIRVNNNSKGGRSLKACSVWLSGQFNGGGQHGGFNVDELKPRDATESTITARFTQMPNEGKLSFVFHRRGESP